MALGNSPEEAPRFTIVTAVHNVARYLPAFIDSVEAQSFGAGRIQIVAVDDGSTDNSPEILRGWQLRRPGLVDVVTKANGGQASARNAGLPLARGEWVTFADPDDLLDPRYFAAVDRFLTRHPDVTMIGTRRRLFFDDPRVLTDHPLERHFQDGDVRVDLRERPTFFHGSAPAAFFPRAELVRLGLQYDVAIRPNFEDGHFCACYLLAQEAPIVGFVAGAEYLYRKRAGSTLAGSWAQSTKYTVVPERGYLDVLERGRARFGSAPEWLQNFVLYELSWYFEAEDRPADAQTAAIGEVAEVFHRHLARIAAHLEPRVVEGFHLTGFPPQWREALQHAYEPEPWRPTTVARDRRDRQARLSRIRYRYTGPAPVERFSVHGDHVLPMHQKTRPLRYFDRTLLHERLVWMRHHGDLQLELDGTVVEIAKRERRPSDVNPIAATKAKRQWPRPTDWFTRAVAKTPPVRGVFGSAWVMVDRLHDADDSAEHLFRWVRKNQPKINAWFVIQKSAPDYRRLRAAGFRRVVPYGSWRWKLLMLNCEHLISSHADGVIHRPQLLRRMVGPRPPWRFTFLQHGVTKDDLSSWLNLQHIDLMVTSTPAEQAFVVGDESGYLFTTKESQLTGLPRFDVIRRAGKRVPPEQRDLILIAPTWRWWLVLPSTEGTQKRAGAVDGVLESEFVQKWSALLTDPRLQDLAAAHGLTIATLLHPNLEQVAEHLGLPPGLQRFSFDGGGGQKLFARSRAVVTDYSSMAFNAAYIDRPVVYFQFDRSRFLEGGHIGRRGYFDYHRDGFGPVALDVDAAVAAITETIEFGPSPRPLYQARIDETFPMRDGQCRKRVVAAIRASTKAVPPIRAANPESAAPRAEGRRERPARGFTPTATAEES